MNDTEPQIAGGKVLWHFLMTLDGFVAGPNHSMDWMTGISFRAGLHAEYTETTGAVLAGRDGFDSASGDSRPYGGAWEAPSLFSPTTRRTRVNPRASPFSVVRWTRRCASRWRRPGARTSRFSRPTSDVSSSSSA